MKGIRDNSEGVRDTEEALLCPDAARYFIRSFLSYFHFSLTPSSLIPLLIAFILIVPLSSSARPLIADLSLRQIEIDSGFAGTDILLFGARNDPGDIVVVIRGPETSYVIRKKQRVAGVWANKKQQVFRDANGFYVVAASRTLEDIQNDYLLKSLRIGIGTEIVPDLEVHKEYEEEFKEAFLKRKHKEHLYVPEIKEISMIGDTLFRTVIRFPENIMRGVYTAEIYLFSDGQLSGIQSTPIIVEKKGFDAFVYDVAYKHPLTYGIVAVTIALLAGWIAGLVFRRV